MKSKEDQTHVSVLRTGSDGREKNVFYSATVQSARSWPAQLFRVLHSLVHSGTLEEKGEASVVRCNQLAAAFAEYN